MRKNCMQYQILLYLSERKKCKIKELVEYMKSKFNFYDTYNLLYRLRKKDLVITEDYKYCAREKIISITEKGLMLLKEGGN
ncbi:MAG: hypothetical protein QXF15_03315 [Candidatus Aenigmatarchaeota archaeon]